MGCHGVRRTWWTGHLLGFHTKRFSVNTKADGLYEHYPEPAPAWGTCMARSRVSQDDKPATVETLSNARACRSLRKGVLKNALRTTSGNTVASPPCARGRHTRPPVGLRLCQRNHTLHLCQWQRCAIGEIFNDAKSSPFFNQPNFG